MTPTDLSRPPAPQTRRHSQRAIRARKRARSAKALLELGAAAAGTATFLMGACGAGAGETLLAGAAALSLTWAIALIGWVYRD